MSGFCKGVLAGFFALSLCCLPASGQADFSGNWAPLYHEDFPERLPGPELGDYMGIPINDAARLRADSYDADRISVVTEYQCRPHGADYSMRGLANMRVDNIIDPDTQRLIASVPINAAARKIVDAWDPARDEAAGLQCKSYGAATIMRVPGRLRISWQDDNTLKIETDAGTQTRLFHFGGTPSSGEPPSLQGYSAARWVTLRKYFRDFPQKIVTVSSAKLMNARMARDIKESEVAARLSNFVGDAGTVARFGDKCGDVHNRDVKRHRLYREITPTSHSISQARVG